MTKKTGKSVKSVFLKIPMVKIEEKKDVIYFTLDFASITKALAEILDETLDYKKFSRYSKFWATSFRVNPLYSYDLFQRIRAKFFDEHADLTFILSSVKFDILWASYSGILLCAQICVEPYTFDRTCEFQGNDKSTILATLAPAEKAKEYTPFLKLELKVIGNYVIADRRLTEVKKLLETIGPKLGQTEYYIVYTSTP